jgi:pantetheine-phosphate adenylyltransferase
VSDSQTAEYRSPCGRILLRVRGGRLAEVRLCRPDGKPGEQALPTAHGGAAEPFLEALGRYFRGGEARIAAERLDLDGVTDFQRRVYGELLKVPFGSVVTYGELAARVGRPGASRAVGQAVGSNPLPLFIPCHRVVAAGRRPGGFGAGLAWKLSLLAHEGWTAREGRLVKEGTRQGEPKTCVYAGSFDPPTNGHMYMIEKGAELFDRLIVAVGVNPNKSYTFSLATRLELLRECTRGLGNVEVDSFEGQFLAHYAQSRGASHILRGIRSDEDYRFEHAMRNVNEDLEPGITTVFLIPPREICEVSSSFVKGLVGFEGWEEVVKPYVPEPVHRRLLASKIRWSGQSAGAEGGTD